MSSRKTLTGLALVLSGLSSVAMASDGTVKFNGQLVDTPCVVSTDTTNQTVVLGNVKVATFKAVKDTSPEQPFPIKLDECSTDVQKTASVAFIGSHDSVDNTLLAVANTSGAAHGVGIEILENDGTALPMGNASKDFTFKKGSNTMMFKARYKSTTTAVTPGPANSQTDFEVSYK